ncbi:hypothetical protein IscW_ISCW011923 [Ixodes scapularis]|uniref:Uncharacterized protein n=1 Tax=Ixodes scapularis TaxID=6945 RepID=B7QBI2_IXOSC|nr:hypothetical protein IscW_ISCW011923 [Ixodes scapularis]|eukprot:XP_002412908.1 hypothetical protein IscW_ISCW011923 [Ixodes scapularis]
MKVLLASTPALGTGPRGSRAAGPLCRWLRSERGRMAGFPEDLDGLVFRLELPQEALSEQQRGSFIPAVMGHHLVEVWGNLYDHPPPGAPRRATQRAAPDGQ